jgi:hypothetical protein
VRPKRKSKAKRAPKSRRRAVAKNPKPRQVKVPRRDLDQAAALYVRFREAPPKKLRVIRALPHAKVLMVVGELEHVQYETTHGRKRYRYKHVFKRNARPLLCASGNGRQLFILEGSYDFTGDGIVDRAA